MRCWGDALYGRLGYGNGNNIGDDENPASVGDVDVGGTVVQLAAGSKHTCALLQEGNVRCWGENHYGQLGYPGGETIGDNETPASAGDVDVGGKVLRLATGHFHSCAIMDKGTVRCWGNGTDGRLGYGRVSDIGDNETPAAAGVIDLGGKAVNIAAGGFHTCAVLEGDGVRCWGAGFRGQLGYGNTRSIGDNETPASAGDVEFW